MDSSVSPKDEIWFLRVCHHISNAVYRVTLMGSFRLWVLLRWVQCCCRRWSYLCAGHKGIWRCRCIAPFSLTVNTSWRWMVSLTPQPLYHRGNPRYQFYNRLIWAPQRALKGEYFLASQTVKSRIIWMGVSSIDTGEPTVWELWMKMELKMENNLSGWTSVCVGRCVGDRLTESKLGGQSRQVRA